jgi:protein-S-isoprenylcysteine O-methyltransferase Ste14
MRLLLLGYSALAYTAFLLSTAWAFLFLAGHGIDGPATNDAWRSLAIDGALLLAFALHHSVMARAGLKRFLPKLAERSTYVLVASLLLMAIFQWWQPVPASVWHTGQPWSLLIWTIYGLGWLIVVGSTYMIDHADFFGLKRAWRHARREAYSPPAFRERFLYAWLRHPMMLGLIITFWATPKMSAGHLFFAVSSTAYIAVGIRFEERDLRTELGPAYDDYAARVPAMLPLKRRPVPTAERPALRRGSAGRRRVRR